MISAQEPEATANNPVSAHELRVLNRWL